ncbi:MAG: RHS repeat-associated core domain-containing protein [Bacteroidales bacterium]|nr:RHS repeat-associated core domain-containing protein [Bacteroidales bacterium]
MKKQALFIAVIGILAVLPGYPQDANENFVRVEVPRIPLTDMVRVGDATVGEVLRSETLYDGLGREVQTVLPDVAPDKKDLIQVTAYDLAGRKVKHYLPYAHEGGGKSHFSSDPFGEIRSFYLNPPAGVPATEYPFARTIFDNSPMNEVVGQGAFGRLWQPETGHMKKYRSGPNTTAVARWIVDGQGKCYLSGTYPPGVLMVNEQWDEDGNLLRAYTDKRGRTLLMERMLDTLAVQTFYVYDDRDLLRVVIPPMAAARGMVENKYVFRYTYDDHKRMIIKKVPGAGKTELVYDHPGRVVLSRDGNLRQDTLWRYIKYDAFGRETERGVYRSKQSRQELQTVLDAQEMNYETRTGDQYTSACFPKDHLRAEHIFYYDDYTFLKDTSLLYQPDDFAREDTGDYPHSFEHWEKTEKVKGLRTGSRVLIPETGAWLESVVWYDDFGRVIQTTARNCLGGTDRISNLYDFGSNLLKTKMTHTDKTGEQHVIVKRFTYDHANRLIQTFYQFDTLPEVCMRENEYDEMGRLIRKKLHRKGPEGRYAQSVDYRYNIRGWMTGINNPDSLGDDLFAETLGYDDPGDYEADSLFNGNISVMRWRTPHLSGTAGYGFRYDGLGRLIKATWKKTGGSGSKKEDYSVPQIRYDVNGNIDTLVRRGATDTSSYGTIDALRYSYDGNRLIAVDDNGEESEAGTDFSDRGSKYDPQSGDNDTLPEYRYDANGNMTEDANKGIVRIRYDHNNLPVEIDFENNRSIHYLYDANGTKLRKEVYGEGGHLVSVTDYDGGIVYRDGRLAYLLTGEGRLVLREDKDPVYEYFLTDHLGNTRVTFRVEGESVTTVQENHYYPFGLSIAGLDYAGLPEEDETHNPYLYNGKEYQEELGLEWYDYGARDYDPQLGRWWSVDPLGEERIQLSPFNFLQNNPINRIDLDGRLDDGYMDMDGNYKWFDAETDNVIGIEGKIWVKVANNRDQFTRIQAADLGGILDFADKTDIQEIKEAGSLSKTELWLDSPAKSIGEGILKLAGNIGYSILNSPKVLFTGTTLAGTSATPNEKMEAFIDFAPALLSFGMTQTGQIIKTGTGMKGYNKFLKKGTTKAMRKGRGWQERVGKMCQQNKYNQSAKEGLDLGSFFIGVFSKSNSEYKK